MNNVKRALAAVGALLALAGQAQAQSMYPTEPPGAEAGYAQFGAELHALCHTPQPFGGMTGYPQWGCMYHDNRPDPGVFISFDGRTEE